MHNAEYVPSNATTTSVGTSGSASTPVFQALRIQYSERQLPPPEHRLGTLLRQKTEAREFFYGIEITARSYGRAHANVLDYNIFGTLLPLFTSLVWLGPDYASVEDVQNVESMRLARDLKQNTITMPHLTCYRLHRERILDFLQLDFDNVLVLRGDQVDSKQDYQHAIELVKEIRRLRGDAISIGVAGYPGGHPDARSLEEDINFLLEKVNAGADFIITQLHFSSACIKQFVRNCRAHGIEIPIIVGVYIPDNLRTLERMLEITRLPMPEDLLLQYRELAAEPNRFRDFAVQHTIEMLEDVLSDASLGVYGVQFFSLNKFKNIARVVNALAPRHSTHAVTV